MIEFLTAFIGIRFSCVMVLTLELHRITELSSSVSKMVFISILDLTACPPHSYCRITTCRNVLYSVNSYCMQTAEPSLWQIVFNLLYHIYSPAVYKKSSWLDTPQSFCCFQSGRCKDADSLAFTSLFPMYSNFLPLPQFCSVNC